MGMQKFAAAFGVIALLAGCGGGGGSSGSGSTGATTTPVVTTPVTTTGCSLRERQDWVAAQMREWYLFPDTLPATLNPSGYATVTDFLDALTATARSQNKDRYFTYLTSIAEENAFYASGSSAGFGFRLVGDGGQRAFIAEVFEGTAALAAGLDRGAEIIAIGTSAGAMRTVSAIIAAEGFSGVTAALGPTTAGTTRVLRVTDASGTRDVTMTKTDYELTAVSSRYGAQVIVDGGRKVGYVNLRTFITPAEQSLRDAFANFRAQGVTDVIVDLRYNGGGLLSTAQVLGNLLGGARSRSDVFAYQTFRPEKASRNETDLFAPVSQSLSPTRIAFIGTGGTASASELVINAFVPYMHANAGLIGANTFGKPVGQIALDRAACDDRLRVIAFALENSARNGSYFNGLAETVEASCQAADDFAHALGSPQEGSTRQALDYLAGRSCSRISTGQSGQALRAATERRELLSPLQPTVAQRDVPGLF